ncbi:MAG: hydroxyacid dehydrogenase, partial [Chloroflexi bacterium]|nr:hydroxyacid dehydrogenase [Chloroflexota bacterium]
IDLAKATDRGIVVMNTPGGNTVSAAEHTFGLMVALARHIPQAHASLSAGHWDRKTFTGVELHGKTLGVVGFGRIGQAVAQRALAFGMTVLANDPYIMSDLSYGTGVELLSLDAMLARADFVTLHSIVSDETREMINAETIAKMKDGARLINVARGQLINEADLAQALDSGKLAGAALDVYQQEPPPENHPLIGHPKVVHTPHLGASTSDAQVAVAVEAAELLITALRKEEYSNVVNPDVLTV